jgi:hypothetical protein
MVPPAGFAALPGVLPSAHQFGGGWLALCRMQSKGIAKRCTRVVELPRLRPSLAKFLVFCLIGCIQTLPRLGTCLKSFCKQLRPAPAGLLSASRSMEAMVPREFKIGELVMYTPSRRSSRAVGGTFTVVALLPEDRNESAYRIRHERSGDGYVARESELRRL